MSTSKFERPTIVMASSSPRRQELVRSLGLPYVVHPSDVDETVGPDMEPDRIVETLALRKAKAVADVRCGAREDGIVIGSDTIVVLDGEVLGKPVNEEDAIRMLSMLQGRSHKVYTGVALIDAAGEPIDMDGAYHPTMHLGDIGQYRVLSESPSGQLKAVVGYTVSKVTFRSMSDEEIRAYVRTGEPLDKAGSYGVQGIGSVFIEKIEGDFYSIMGLPLNLLYQMLLKFGVSPFLEK